MCYAGFFFLQGYYKAAIYAIKVRLEFTILNQLRSALPSAYQQRSTFQETHDGRAARSEQFSAPRGSDDSDVEIIEMVVNEPSPQHGGIRLQKDVEVYSMRREDEFVGQQG